MKANFRVYLLCFGLLFFLVFQTAAQSVDKNLELVVQSGHTGLIDALAYSPDQKWLASGSWDGKINVWDAETGLQIRSIKNGSEVSSLAFTADGRSLISASLDGKIKIIDFSNGVISRRLTDGQKNFTRICLSPNGASLFAADTNHNITEFDLVTGKALKTLSGHTDDIFALAISPDGKTLASGGADKIVRFWDAEIGKEISESGQMPGNILTLDFSHDGKTLAFGGVGNYVAVVDVKTGAVKTVFKNHRQAVDAAIFSRDDKTVVSGDSDGIIKVWNAETGAETASRQTEFETVKTIVFRADGKSFAVSGDGVKEQNITIWKFPDLQISNVMRGHASNIWQASYSPDGKTLAVGLWSDQILLWNLAAGAAVKLLNAPTSSVEAVKFSPDGKLLATVSGLYQDERRLTVWTSAGERLYSVAAPGNTFVSLPQLIFSPDSKILIGEGFSTLTWWDAATGREIRKTATDWEYTRNMSFSGDGRHFAAGGEEGKITVWNAATGAPIAAFKNLGAVENFAFDETLNLLAVACKLGEVKIYDLKSQKIIKTFKGSAAVAYSVKFDDAKQTLSIIRQNRSVETYRLATGEFSATNGDKEVAPIYDVSPDRASYLATDGEQLQIRNLESGRLIASLVGLDAGEWVVVTPDGRFDASEGALKFMHYAYGLEVINLEQLKEMYYEPNLLSKVSGFSREPLRPIVPLADVKLFPEVVSQTVAPDSTVLTVKLKNRGGGIGAVKIFVGNELGEKLAVEDARDAKLKADPNLPEATLEVDLKGTNFLKGRANKITVVTSNYLKEIGKGNIQSRGSELVWLAPGKDEELSLPTVYAIVGGVSDYAGEQLDLRFAAKDAEDFSNALSLGARKLFCAKENPNCIDKVNVTTLSTSGKAGTILPTKENFVKTFREVAAKAKPEDILIVYLSGHGMSFGAGEDNYFYLTQDARTTNREDLAKVLTTSTISSEELSDWLTPNAGNADDIFVKALKQVVILDTCASGSAAAQLALTAKRELSSDQIRAVEFLKDKTGTFVLMASTADAPSYEASQFGQGLLTYSLLQAMKGAALDKGGYIDVQQLFSYAQKEVPQLAQNIGGVQRPIVSAPLGKTFVIGQMSEAEKNRIDLPSPKPLMLRPLLTAPPINNDPLKLIPELRKRFDAESSYEVARQRGEKAPALIYIDDDSFPGAVRLTGTYTVEGEKVRIKAYLVRNEEVLADLPEIVSNRENAADELIKAVAGQLKKLK